MEPDTTFSDAEKARNIKHTVNQLNKLVEAAAMDGLEVKLEVREHTSRTQPWPVVSVKVRKEF
ncbi:hypothetical protein EVB27_047 [Rhizobium phage RHph_TM16]|nr:hypothetical protein EVB27_047 [Rhizobium phage RHph_TM16]